MSYHIIVVLGESHECCLCRYKLQEAQAASEAPIACGHVTAMEAAGGVLRLREGYGVNAAVRYGSCLETPPRDRKQRRPPQKAGVQELTSATTPAHAGVLAFTGDPGANRGKGRVTCHACGSSKGIRIVEVVRASYPVTGISASPIGEPEIKADGDMRAYDSEDVHLLRCACGNEAPLDLPGTLIDFGGDDDSSGST